MVKVVLRAQLPTLAEVWTLGAKLWTPRLRNLSCLRAKTDKKQLLSTEGSTNLHAKSAANNSWEEKTTEKPLMASSRTGQMLRGHWRSENPGREPLPHKYTGRDTEQDH